MSLTFAYHRVIDKVEGGFPVAAVAEASFIGTQSPYHPFVDKGPVKAWLLNRVVVTPERFRGNGLGSKALQGLLEKLSKETSCQVLIVTPGGYNADPNEQENFYLKNGFEVAYEAEGGGKLMIWSPKKEEPCPTGATTG